MPGAGLDDGRDRRPDVVSIDDLLGRTLVYGALSVLIVARRPRRAGRADRPSSATRLDQRQVVLLVLLLSAVLYAPLRQRLWLGHPAGRARRPRQPLRRRRRARLHPRDDRRGRRAARRGRRRGGHRVRRRLRQRRGRPQRRRAAGRDPRRAPGRDPDPADHLPRRRGRPAGAAGPRAAQPALAAATRSCSATWSGRPRPRPAPAGWPTSSRRAASGWSSPARRSAAGSAATCTTASARRSAAWSSSSSRPGCWSTATPTAANDHIAATSHHVQEVVADVRRLVHDLRPPALDDRGLVGALRPAGRAALDRRAARCGRGRRPRRPARGGRGRGVPDRRRGDDQRRPARARPDAARSGSTSPTATCVVEVADDGVGIDADAQAGVGLLSLRERAAELGGHSEVTCPPGRRHRRPRPATPEEEPAMSEQPIRVVVVDDHQIVRDGLVSLLGALDGIEVVGHRRRRPRRAPRRRRDPARRGGDGHPDAAPRRHRGDPVHHRQPARRSGS